MGLERSLVILLTKEHRSVGDYESSWYQPILRLLGSRNGLSQEAQVDLAILIRAIISGRYSLEENGQALSDSDYISQHISDLFLLLRNQKHLAPEVRRILEPYRQDDARVADVLHTRQGSSISANLFAPSVKCHSIR